MARTARDAGVSPQNVGAGMDDMMAARWNARLAWILLITTAVLAIGIPLAIQRTFNRVVETPVVAYESDRFRSGLDACRKEPGALFVRGWAFVEGETGVRPIRVLAIPEHGNAVQIPSRVERREDLPELHGRPHEHDALHDGFSASSADLGGRLQGRVRILLLREDGSGRVLGGEHACD